MTTPTPTAFEDQLTDALQRRAAPVTADAGARTAIDERIATRTRIRRTRRVGVAALVAIVLVAGALAVARRGHDDASVVTGPGTPVIDFPHLADAGAAKAVVLDYVPGRTISLMFLPPLASAGSTPSSTESIQTGRSSTVIETNSAQVGSVSFRMTVTDASIDEVGRSIGGAAAGQPSSVGQLPAEYFTNPTGSDFPGTIVWRPAPGVVAELGVVVAASTGNMPPEELTQLVAVGLVAVDDVAWQQLVDPAPSARRLGLTEASGQGEIGSYVPATGAGGGPLMQVLDTPGFAPGTFQLTATGSAASDTFDAVDDPDHVDVRGTSGLVGDTPGYLSKVYGSTRSLSWVEDGVLYRLDFPNGTTPADAVKVAERLTVLTSDQWHELLFPTALRTDLVPMPEFLPLVGPPPDGPVASTVLSVPSSPSSVTPTTGR